MAIYVPFTPTTAIGRAMFNFDMFGKTNYKIVGLVRVSVSDNFSYSDYLSTNYSTFYSALYTGGSGEVPWTSSMLDGVKSALYTFSQFINLQFDWKGDYDYVGSDPTANPEDVGRSAVSDINISWINRTDSRFSGISGGSGDNFIFGYTGGAGDIFLNNAYLPLNLDGNSYTLQTLIHEIGHSLGLSHPHSGYNYTTNSPAISADYAATQYLGFQQLGFSINSAADMYKEYFTVMAYDDQISTLPNSSYVYRSYTPMILDVIALQQAYGEGAGTSGSGNDTINVGTAGYRTYFDTGGVDTVDLTHYTDAAYLHMGVSITGAAHLVGVAMSKFDAKNTILNGGNPANLRWLYGEYENAIGSSSDDLMIGNALNNKLDGRGADDFLAGDGGDDDISGGDGNDIMDGGDGDDRFDWDPSQRSGADTMEGGLGNDIYVLDSINDKIVEAASEGLDTVYVGFNYSIANTSLENIRTFNNLTTPLIFTGNSWGNIIVTGDGADSIYGNEGEDTLNGGNGNDFIDGGTGTDVATYSGVFTRYVIASTNVPGRVTIRDTTGSEGTDTLSSIEFIQFADRKFEVVPNDSTPPVVLTFSPTDNAKGVAVGANLVVTFSEQFVTGAGTIEIRTGPFFGTTVQSFDVTSPTGLSLIGKTLTIDPKDDLAPNADYVVAFSPGSLKDLAGNAYAGGSDWNFQTGAVGGSPTSGIADEGTVYVFKSEKVGLGINKASFSYYYTTDAGAAGFFASQPSYPWVQQKSTFEDAHSNPGLAVPVYQFFSEKAQGHYFAVGEVSRDYVINKSKSDPAWDWVYERVGFQVYTSAAPKDAAGKAAIPVYQAWITDKDFNPNNGIEGGHFWTADLAEYNAKIKLVGVVGEGISFYGEPLSV